MLKKESWPLSGERGGGLAPWSRRAISWASVMAAMTLRSPLHRLQTETSIANTLANNEAHPRRALARGASSDNEEVRHGCRPVASNSGTCVATTGTGLAGSIWIRERNA